MDLNFSQDGQRPVVFLTGVTGGLGSALLPRLLASRPDSVVVALVRGQSDAEAAQRLAQTLAFAQVDASEHTRVLALRGDMGEPRLGLPAPTYERLAACTQEIFHLAADLRFDLPIEASRRLNVETTQTLLGLAQLAAQGPLRRLNYVSTAYVSGTRRDLVRETELNTGQDFFNAYEQSKMEAETLVQQLRQELPLSVYRPSMIVGEAQTGKIRHFFGFYEFLKLANKGKISVFPAEPSARPDLVPMDYVADAITLLSSLPQACGQTFHLAAGLERSICIGHAVDLLGRSVTFEGLANVPKVVAPAKFEKQLSGRLQALFKNSALNILLRSYMPYLTFERAFDVQATAALLDQHGVHLAPTAQWLPVIARYALQARFGEQEMALA